MPATVDRVAVQRVQVLADWLTYATAGATVLAAMLALLSIVYSARLARKADERLLHERRLDFELTLLAEMSRQHAITGTQHLTGYARALLPATAPDDDLPVLRAVVGVRVTEAGREELRHIKARATARAPHHFLADPHATRDVDAVVAREITAAIERRLPR